MPHKIKVILGLMALGAVFSVYVFANSFNFGGLSLANLKMSALDIVDNDWDNDGLTNKEEAYWGTDPYNPDTDGDEFLDGEEVASGHDPLMPGPDDLLPNSDNLTRKMSYLTLSGMYEGSLNPQDPEFEESMNKLALVVLDDALNSFKTDLSGVSLKVVNSDKNFQQKYIEDFSKTFEGFVVVFAEQMGGLEGNLINIGLSGLADANVVKNFQESSAKYKRVFDDLARMNVPKGWESNHLGTMKLAGDLSLVSEAVLKGETDPIKATVGLNNLLNLWEILPKITEAYSKKISGAGLNSDKTIFK